MLIPIILDKPTWATKFGSNAPSYNLKRLRHLHPGQPMSVPCLRSAVCLLYLSFSSICFVATRAAAQGAAPAPAAAPPSAPSVRFTGYLQARETYRDEVGLTGSINRARLTAYGGLARDVTWRVQGEFRTGAVGTGKASVSLQDAYIRYRTGNFGIQAGQYKTPFTREFI